MFKTRKIGKTSVYICNIKFIDLPEVLKHETLC